MSNTGKEITHYEVAERALELAIRTQDYPGDSEKTLETAEKFRKYLIQNAKFESDDVPEFTYFADERRRSDGTFPDYTYWIRFDNRAHEIVVTDDGKGRQVRTDAYGCPASAAELGHNYPNLTRITDLSEVPGWAR